MSRYSSDVDDQRATEIARVADLSADRWREFSTSDFPVADSEENTDPGQLLPQPDVYRIVIGKPVVEDEFGALEEVVKVLGNAIERDRPQVEKRSKRWIATFAVVLALACAPYDLLASIAALIRSLLG